MDRLENLWLRVYKIPDNSASDKAMYSMWGEYMGNGKLFKYKCTHLGCRVVLEVNFPRYDKILDKVHSEDAPLEASWRCPLCTSSIKVRL